MSLFDTDLVTQDTSLTKAYKLAKNILEESMNILIEDQKTRCDIITGIEVSKYIRDSFQTVDLIKTFHELGYSPIVHIKVPQDKFRSLRIHSCCMPVITIYEFDIPLKPILEVPYKEFIDFEDIYMRSHGTPTENGQYLEGVYGNNIWRLYIGK